MGESAPKVYLTQAGEPFERLRALLRLVRRPYVLTMAVTFPVIVERWMPSFGELAGTPVKITLDGTSGAGCTRDLMTRLPYEVSEP